MQLNYKLIFISLIFLLGINFYLKFNNNIETMDNRDKCYNMLIEKDGKIVLFNSKIPKKKGSNPIEFNNLDEYAEFYEKQKNLNKDCKLLYLQYTTDTQNNDLIQIKPSIFEVNTGLPITKKKETTKYFEKNKILDATLNSTPNSDIKFNTGMFSGFDQYNQNIGLDTPLDKIYHELSEVSRNPADPKWGGKEFTKKALDRGEYEGRYVYKYTNPTK